MKVTFVRSGNSGIDPISQNQGDSLKNTSVDVTYFDIVGKGIVGYLKSIFRLRVEIRTNKPDILHAHYAYSGFVASLALPKRPVVVSLMGSDVNKTNRFVFVITRVFVVFFWKVTIVKTQRMKEKLGINSVKVLPNGVDLRVFFPASKTIALKEISWDKNKKNILFGSDPRRKEKNYDLFASVVERYKLEDSNFEIHFLCNIPCNKVYLYYCAADISVLTSHWEGSPNVIKEAMACNCPIVSTDAGDIKEIISSTDGCYITSFDPVDVYEKIKLALEFGKRTVGRENIKHLSSELVAERLNNIYEEVLHFS
jgi:teichuronic acid biosynthesis glycosyltransferase TuaC